MKDVRFGIYFYPWYNKTRWAAQPRLCTPHIGEYDSADPDVIDWQIDLLQECGFDYLIFEMVPTGDWGFDTVNRAVGLAIERLRIKGMRWTFLMDAYVVQQGKDAAQDMSELIAHMEQEGWHEGLPRGRSGLPLLFVFFPVPRDADQLRQTYGSRYELRFPCYMPHWGSIEKDFERFSVEPFGSCIERARLKQGPTVFDALVPEGYISFFETTPNRTSFDGFASVYPSFEDRHLGRPVTEVPEMPVIPPDGGATLRASFEKALATNAHDIVVYGWNEYFEAATIEPTREYGRRHVEICREIIAKTRTSS